MSFTTLFQSRYSRLGKYGVDYPYFQMSCSYVMLIAMSNNSHLTYFKCSRSVGLVACAFGQIYDTLEIVRLAFSLRTAQDQIHEFRRLARCLQYPAFLQDESLRVLSFSSDLADSSEFQYLDQFVLYTISVQRVRELWHGSAIFSVNRTLALGFLA